MRKKFLLISLVFVLFLMACSSKIEPNTELSFNLDTAETLKITSDFDNEGTLILKVKNFEGGNYKILLVSKGGNNKDWITEEINSDVEIPVEPWRDINIKEILLINTSAEKMTGDFSFTFENL